MALAQQLHCARLVGGRRCFSSVSTPIIRENDVLLIKQEGSKFAKWHLTPPLQSGRRVKLSYGTVLSADDLIGKNVLEKMKDDTGRKIEVQRPPLAGYVVHSKRIATPIYPQDAATIVSLLDLHPTRYGEEDEDGGDVEGQKDINRTVDSTPFEIFEAGTGMGSLTLHIARAIHAANPPTPRSLRSALPRSFLLSLSAPAQPDAQPSSPSTPPSSPSPPSPSPLSGLEPSEQADLETYRSKRRAILHTLDKNEKHSLEAYKFVRNFNRAQYLPSIDFYTNTSISAFFESRLSSSRTPFLARAILDLPGAHTLATPVMESLLPGGLLVVFAPSISQIAQFQQWSVDTKQNARLERVLELPTSIASETTPDSGAGGRPWEVKVVRAREEGARTGEWVQVMRPRVGDRVAGGGFVAVLRKMAANVEPDGVEAEALKSSGGEDSGIGESETEVGNGEAVQEEQEAKTI